MCILMVNCWPVVFLIHSFVVFNTGQVLQRIVLHSRLPGVSFVRDVRVACMSKSLSYFLGVGMRLLVVR